jgi:hypothetical protein
VHLGAVESSLGGQAARNGADRFEPKKQGKMGWGSGRARGQESMEGGGGLGERCVGRGSRRGELWRERWRARLNGTRQAPPTHMVRRQGRTGLTGGPPQHSAGFFNCSNIFETYLSLY